MMQINISIYNPDISNPGPIIGPCNGTCEVWGADFSEWSTCNYDRRTRSRACISPEPTELDPECPQLDIHTEPCGNITFSCGGDLCQATIDEFYGIEIVTSYGGNVTLYTNVTSMVYMCDCYHGDMDGEGFGIGSQCNVEINVAGGEIFSCPKDDEVLFPPEATLYRLTLATTGEFGWFSYPDARIKNGFEHFGQKATGKIYYAGCSSDSFDLQKQASKSFSRGLCLIKRIDASVTGYTVHGLGAPFDPIYPCISYTSSGTSYSQFEIEHYFGPLDYDCIVKRK